MRHSEDEWAGGGGGGVSRSGGGGMSRSGAAEQHLHQGVYSQKKTKGGGELWLLPLECGMRTL
jgi:hypothetical protein